MFIYDLQIYCFCLNRRGLNGLERCYHIGGVIFATKDFSRCGLKDHDEPISCTSRLCTWNIPRNMRVEPKPIDKIVLKKICYGKTNSTASKITSYDPRAPADRCRDVEVFNKLNHQ